MWGVLALLCSPLWKPAVKGCGAPWSKKSGEICPPPARCMAVGICGIMRRSRLESTSSDERPVGPGMAGSLRVTAIAAGGLGRGKGGIWRGRAW